MAFGNHRPAYETYFRTASFPPPAPPLGGCIGSLQDQNWVELLIIPFRPETERPHLAGNDPRSWYRGQFGRNVI
jgi:hypothetical protein